MINQKKLLKRFIVVILILLLLSAIAGLVLIVREFLGIPGVAPPTFNCKRAGGICDKNCSTLLGDPYAYISSWSEPGTAEECSAVEYCCIFNPVIVDEAKREKVFIISIIERDNINETPIRIYDLDPFDITIPSRIRITCQNISNVSVLGMNLFSHKINTSARTARRVISLRIFKVPVFIPEDTSLGDYSCNITITPKNDSYFFKEMNKTFTMKVK